MKINKLYLENFGKFEDYSLDLTAGFNVIQGENEDGKSTLMAFIQMMFYGYGGRARDLAINLRRKYRPWRGQTMQGKVWFESGGSLYRLERSFGQSNSSDQVTLWNETRGERQKLASGNDPGREFFGLGEEAFARSVFIRQGGSLISAVSSQDELTQRLLNLVTTGSEETSYQAALSRLSDASEALVSRSGKKGRLVISRNQLADLRLAREQAERDEAEKLSAQERLEAMAKERRRIGEEVKNLEAMIHCQDLAKERAEIEGALNRARQREELLDRLQLSQAKLAHPDGDLDELFLKNGEDHLQIWQELTKKSDQAAAEAAQLEKDLAELAGQAPIAVDWASLSQIREGDKKRADLKEEARQLALRLTKLQDYLRKADEKDLLAGELTDASQTLTESAAESSLSQEAMKRIEQELNGSRRLYDQSQQDTYRMELAVEHLSGQLRQTQAELTELEEQQAAQIHRASQDLVQLRRSNSQSDKAQRQRKSLWTTLAVLTALLAGYLALSQDPLYALGWLASAGFAAAALRKPLSKSLEAIAQAESQISQLRTMSQARIDHTQTKVNELKQGLSERTSQLSPLEQQSAKLKDLLDNQVRIQAAENENMTQARARLIKAEIRWQALTEELAKREADLMASPVQGTRFALMQAKQAIDETETAIAGQSEAISRILDDHDSADLEQLTSRYYDHVTWQANLARTRAALLKHREAMEQDEREADLAKERLMEHFARYQVLDDPTAAQGILSRLKEEHGEALKLSLQLEASLENRSELEERFTLEALKQRQADLAQQMEQMGVKLDPDGEILDPQALAAKHKAHLANLAQLDQEMAGRQAQIREQYKNLANLSQIDDRISQVREVIARQEAALASLKLAHNVMGEAFEELQKNFGPLLNEATAKILSKLTRGKYQQVLVSRALEVAVEDPASSSLYEWGYLSGGTIDQTYLALRLAMAGLIGQDRGPLPLFLDDVFTQYDDGRALAGLEFLQQSSGDPAQENQVVLFTCHHRIRDWASTAAGVNLQII